jgi:hypothetical protein
MGVKMRLRNSKGRFCSPEEWLKEKIIISMFFLETTALSLGFWLSPKVYAWLQQPQEVKQNVEIIEPSPIPSLSPTPNPFPLRRKTKILIEKNPKFVQKLQDFFGNDWKMWAELIARESSFNPGAINSKSGSCGFFQAYPCKKMKCELSDIDCQLQWGNDYVSQRYQTIEKALKFHNRNGWY